MREALSLLASLLPSVSIVTKTIALIQLIPLCCTQKTDHLQVGEGY